MSEFQWGRVLASRNISFVGQQVVEPIALPVQVLLQRNHPGKCCVEEPPMLGQQRNGWNRPSYCSFGKRGRQLPGEDVELSGQRQRPTGWQRELLELRAV